MAIEFNCPYCTSVIRVSDDAAGKSGRCPKCDTRLRVPKPEIPVDSPPAAAPPAASPPPQEAAPDSKTKLPAPPDDGFEAIDFNDLAAGDPETVVIPEVPEPPAASTGLLIDTGDAAEPVYQRVAERGRRNWAGMIGPLVFGSILIAAAVAYWWMNRETMTGTLTGEPFPIGTTVSTTIQRFVPDVSTEVWQASLSGLREDPVIVESELMVLEIRGDRRGLVVSVSSGTDTKLVRVDVRQNRVLNQFCIDRAETLDDARAAELKDAATRFLRDWDNAATAGMLMGNGRDYRDSVGLNSLTKGLGYHSVAMVGNTMYPCVHEDINGRLYFVVPHGIDEFTITERDIPDRDSVFPTEYEFTVQVEAPAAEPEPESTDEPADDVDESEPEGDMSSDMPMPEEAMEGGSESESEEQ